SKSTWNSRTTWVASAKTSEVTSLRNNRSRQRPTRSSLRDGNWVSANPSASGAYRAAHSPTPSIGAWQVRAEKLLEAHPLEDSIDDGQGADAARVECPALGASDLTGAWGGGGTGDVTSFEFWHWCGS